jgi:hypothetical protein
MLVLCWAMAMDRLTTVDFMIASFGQAMRAERRRTTGDI